MQLEQLHVDCLSQIFSQFDPSDTNQTLVLLCVSKRVTEVMTPFLMIWLNDFAVNLEQSIHSHRNVNNYISFILKGESSIFCQYLRNPLNLHHSVYFIHYAKFCFAMPPRHNIVPIDDFFDNHSLREFAQIYRVVKYDANKVTFLAGWLFQQCQTIADVRAYLKNDEFIGYLPLSVKDDELEEVNQRYRVHVLLRRRINALQ